MTRTQGRIALIAVLVAGAAIFWLVTHRAPGSRGFTGPSLQTPKLLKIVARSSAGERELQEGAELTTDEVLDFQIQVFDQGFAYVLRVDGDTVGLAFGQVAADEAWAPGVYAPEWADPRGGMKLSNAGKLKLYVMLSPLPLVGVSGWSADELENPLAKCPGCGVLATKFSVVAPK